MMKTALALVILALVAIATAQEYTCGDSCGCNNDVEININIGKDHCKDDECACPCPDPEECEDCDSCCQRDYPCPTCPPLDTCETLACNNCSECDDYEGDLAECCPEICYECIGVYEPYDGASHSIVIFCGEGGNQRLSFVEGESTFTVYNDASPDLAILKGNLETTGGSGSCLGGDNFYVEISMIRVDADEVTVKVEQGAVPTSEWRYFKFLSAKLTQTDCTYDCAEWDMEIRHDYHGFQLGLGASLKDPENAVFGGSTWIKITNASNSEQHYYGDINIKFHEICPECPPKIESQCETAYGYLPASDNYEEEKSICFTDISGLGTNNWGWTLGSLSSGTTYDDIELYAGAGQCDLDKGVLLGGASIEVSEDGKTVTVTAEGAAGAWFKDAHVWAGCTKTPYKDLSPTIAPGQYNWKSGVNDDEFVAEVDVSCEGFAALCRYSPEGCPLYVIIHAETCVHHYEWD